MKILVFQCADNDEVQKHPKPKKTQEKINL